jgi:hypothetical protein
MVEKEDAGVQNAAVKCLRAYVCGLRREAAGLEATVLGECLDVFKDDAACLKLKPCARLLVAVAQYD